ncbi:7,8-dihydro-8-oxoguanine triphosphatase [Blattella germanica]|nr:7,8-dihydro-8-oxoguanine triphosphatase [Blattella germanica]
MATSRKILTLAMVRKANKILLGLKKKGFGEGKWNGFGGKVEKGETICEGAIRFCESTELLRSKELEEESGLIAKNLVKIGILDFEFVGDPVILEVHVYDIIDYEGEPRESEEMLPQWFSVDDIPYDKMWADDLIWYPLYLKGDKFKAYFLYQGFDTILKHEITPLEHLSL